MARKFEPQAAHAETSCIYCGDSALGPLGHFGDYVSQSLEIIEDRARHLPILRTLYRIVSKPSVTGFNNVFFKTLNFFGLTKFSRDIEKAKTIRSRTVWEEADKRGIPIEQVVFLGTYTDWYRAQIGDAKYYFLSLPIPEKFLQNAFNIDDKSVLKERLNEQGIPVPFSETVTSLKEAEILFERFLERPLAVKPRTGSRGRHTSTQVVSKEDLFKAFKIAQKLNHYVQVEKCLEGSVCRATVIDGVLRGFLEAKPPSVVGDGVSTVGELIDEKNRTRHVRVADVIVKQEMLDHIGRQGYDLGTVVPEGKYLSLSFRTGRLFGGRTKEMLPTVHPKLKDYIERASRAIGATIVGFDLIIANPESDPDTQEWGIIEANGLPFIDLHDFALEGEPANAAQYVWDLWKKV